MAIHIQRREMEIAEVLFTDSETTGITAFNLEHVRSEQSVLNKI
jgi:hypothetical protein